MEDIQKAFADFQQEVRQTLNRIETLATINAKNVLLIDDVVTLTGLSKSHVYRLTCTNQIPYYKSGRHIYFDRCEVETWLKRNKVVSTQEAEQKACDFVLRKKGGINVR